MSFETFYVTMDIIISVAASVLNLFAILIFLRSRGPNQRIFYFILFLAISDFLIGSFAIPYALAVSLS